MTLALILPFFNRADLTVRCLESVKAAGLPVGSRVIAVNDGSDASEAARVRQSLGGMPHVWLQHAQNQGFRRAVHTAMQAVDEPYVLLLNSDTVVSAGFAAKLLAPMQQDAGVKATAPVTNARNDLFQFRSGGGPYRGPQLQLRVRRTAERLAAAYHGQTLESAYLTGSCLALERAAFTEVGLFDEGYRHGYFEDLDLCCRLRSRGARLLICEDCFVYHLGNGSYRQLGARRRELTTANFQTFCKRWSHLPEHPELLALLRSLGARAKQAEED